MVVVSVCRLRGWEGGGGEISFQPTQAQLSNHVLNTGDLITSLQRREKTATGSMQGQMELLYSSRRRAVRSLKNQNEMIDGIATLNIEYR